MKWPSVICVGQFFQVFRCLLPAAATRRHPQVMTPIRPARSPRCDRIGRVRRHRPNTLATLGDGPISLLRKTIEEVGPTLCMIWKAMQAQHQTAAPRFEDREIEPVGA